ncbi:MAG: hypothetical protein M5U27_14020 [Gaiella sp.]|nr:hypothetical protein [Gaiella sp.]
MNVLAPSVRFHRSMLVGGTIGLSVGTSRVATDPGELGSWLLLAGCGVLIVVADLSRDVEEDARALAASSGVSVPEARHDVYAAGHSVPMSLAFAAAIALTIAAFVVYATTSIAK